MRRTLYAALLCATTALYPSDARADPISGLLIALTNLGGVLGGALSGLGFPTLGGLFGAGAVGSGAFITGFALTAPLGYSAFGSFLVNAALSIGISALANALRPRPAVPDPGARLVNLRQPVSYFEHVYGLVRKGGPVNFWQAKNGYRYYDVILAARQINGIRAWYADETEVTTDVDGYAQENRFESNGRSRLRLQAFLGAAGQVAPALLTAAFTEWTADHDMAGLAHALVIAENAKAEDFSTVYPSGREPAITPLIEGYLCYDPREVGQSPNNSASWAWTTNAALIIADWVTSADGLNREVDWDKVAIEADAADLEVLDRNASPLPKWQLSGTYSSAEQRESVRAQMGVACDAFFYEDSNGYVGFHLGRWIEPTVTVNDDDILSIQYGDGQPGTDVTNAFSLEYTEETAGYREAAAATYVIDAPDEPYEEDTLRVFWCPNHNQAVRIEKRLLLVSRSRYRIAATLKYHGARLIGQRFFRLQHAEFGNLDQVFEVDKLKRNDDGISWYVEAHSVEEEDFDFDASIEEPAKPLRTSIATSKEVPDPENVTAILQDIAGSVGIRVAWDAPPRDTLLNQVRYRITGLSPPDAWVTLPVPAGQYFQNIVGVEDGVTYDIQVRTITATGLGSNWVPEAGNSPSLTVSVIMDPVPPSPPTSVTSVLDGANADVAWTNPTSLNHRATIVRRGARNWFSSASAITVLQPWITAYEDTTLPDGTSWFWASASNGSGVESTEAQAAVEVTKAPTINLMDKSHDLSSGNWGSFANWTANATDGWLSGASGAGKLYMRASPQTAHYKSRTFGAYVVDSPPVTYVLSAIVKPAELSNVRLYANDGTTTTTVLRGRDFNLAAGTSSAYQSAPTSYGMTSLGDGWWLVWIEITAAGTAVGTMILRIPDATGDNTSGFYVDHVQIEAGVTTPSGLYYRRN